MAYNVLLVVVLNTTRVLHVEPRNFNSSAGSPTLSMKAHTVHVKRCVSVMIKMCSADEIVLLFGLWLHHVLFFLYVPGTIPSTPYAPLTFVSISHLFSFNIHHTIDWELDLASLGSWNAPVKLLCP